MKSTPSLPGTRKLQAYFKPVTSPRGVQVLVWHTRVDVYRVKTGLMATVNNMAVQVSGDPKTIAMGNVAHRAAPRWVDQATRDDTEWWHSTPSRTTAGQEAVARVFHTWVRAYVVALEANAQVSGEGGKGYREVLGALKTPHNIDSNGRVKTGAVMESFASCPGDVVYHTLCLLNWSGHLCAIGTLNTYNYFSRVAPLADLAASRAEARGPYCGAAGRRGGGAAGRRGVGAPRGVATGANVGGFGGRVARGVATGANFRGS